ncbi:MAG: uroporphyrinogen decarboxylase [Rhodospirillaceae bacterium]|nr:uroporphyrinogen decarboxylase [Rhodospirillaceae bacterium]
MTPSRTVSSPALLRVLAGERLDPPPLWLMRQAGRYLPEYRAIRARADGFLNFCYAPDLATEATLQPIRRFDFDAAILFSDILVVPDGLGAKVAFREGEGPVLEPVLAETLGALKPGRVRAHLAPVYETVARVRAALAHDKALIGFAGAPWTVACYMAEGRGSRDWTAAKTWLWRDPAGFGALIDILIEATIDHLAAQIEAGADCVQLFDSWTGVLPDREFRLYSIEPTRRIAAALKSRHPGIRVIGFPRGSGTMLREYAAETGVDAVSLDYSVPLAVAKPLQAQVAVQGNLDPVLLLAGGAALMARVAETKAALGGGPHIFNLGHGILPATPPEHVAALVQAVRGP